MITRLRRIGSSAVLSPLRTLALVVALVLLIPAAALADGDPGSDVLVYQPLFVTSDAGMSIAQQERLSSLLAAAKHAGVPIRVAVIAHPDDLGAVTELWGKPKDYARFLGYELSLAYRQRLLVVMPDGLGFNWPGHPAQAADRVLSDVRIPSRNNALGVAAQSAVIRLAQIAGVRLHAARTAGPATTTSEHLPTSSPTARRAAGGGAVGVIGLAVLAAVGLVLAGRAGVLRHRKQARRRARGAHAQPPRRVAILQRPAALAAASVVAVAVLAAAVVHLAGSSAADALATNPYLDPGTPLAERLAPGFTLTDQLGRPVSLSAYRGKVVFLDFNDSECTTICPLTTTAMLDAQRMLGPAGSQVQLVGVDANPKATSIEDVLSYSQLHGMLGHWHFLTGSLPQLKHVWHEYGVQADIEHGLISHTPALYIIDPHGQLRRLYITQQSYSAVGQFGQLLAQEASRLLPGHPTVNANDSYAQIPSIAPTATVALRTPNGGRVALGPGPARLFLFFATWDQEVTSLGGQLDALNRYQAAAKQSRLPALTAIDEGSVEPSPRALSGLLGGLARPLSYPVGIDTTGRIADGYEVQGQPWLVLTSPSGQILWYWNVDTQGWLSQAKLTADVKAALARVPNTPTGTAAVSKELTGSPAVLATLHQQADRLLGSDAALTARIHALRGYPIVINAWASWCTPCRAEFNLFASASARYGRRVAFLGADTDDSPGDAQSFLTQHPVSYPSYQTTSSQLRSLLPGGLEGVPTTVFINPNGKITTIHTGQYESQGSLDSDIQTDARNN